MDKNIRRSQSKRWRFVIISSLRLLHTMLCIEYLIVQLLFWVDRSVYIPYVTFIYSIVEKLIDEVRSSLSCNIYCLQLSDDQNDCNIETANLRLTDLIRRFCSIHRCINVLSCHRLSSAGLLTEWINETDHDFDHMWMGNYGIIIKENEMMENWSDHINENIGGDIATASIID